MRNVSEALVRLQANLHCADSVMNPDKLVFNKVLTDTRADLQGCLLVALRGERFDAHDFIDATCKAVAVVVDHPLDIDVPQIVVENTLRALGQLGAWWRDDYTSPVVAITGSNGKTSCKEMTAAILRECGRVHATKGNLNNEIGVPMTLFGLDDSSEFAVIEMGANHSGEIARLVAMIRPDAALVNNAGPAHLEGFGSLDGVAAAKGEAFAGLTADSVAIINANDAYSELWLRQNKAGKVIRFGMDVDAEVTGEWQPEGTGGTLRIRYADESCEVGMPLAGAHNAMNALASCALSLAVGADLKAVKQGLQSLHPVAGRLQTRQVTVGKSAGATVIDDTYNANPASFKAGINVLAGMPGELILVMGDMGELGDNADALHAEVGAYAKTQGIKRLYAVGVLSQCAVSEFGEGAAHFENQNALIETLKSTVTAEQCLLIKGSRTMAMERVVAALCDAEQSSNDHSVNHREEAA